MLVQFQKEFWTRFSIPLVRLDSVGIQRIREQIPGNQNPFHYFDKTIVSVDTLKNDREYRVYLDNASWDIIVIDECQNVAERARGAQKSQRAKLAECLATWTETLILLSARPALHLRIVTTITSIGRAARNVVLSTYRSHSALQGRTPLAVLQQWKAA
jgi:hypothetical protein